MNRGRLIDMENRLVVARGWVGGRERDGLGVWVGRCKLTFGMDRQQGPNV